MHEQAKGGRGGRTGHAEEGETPPVRTGGWGHTWDSQAETGSEWVLVSEVTGLENFSHLLGPNF